MQTAAPPDAAAELDMRQLRHHTKNALARILAQVSSELSTTSTARRVATEVERRVLLTARISDALFGLTRAPGPFDERLDSLCRAVVELMGEDGQCLALTCDIGCSVPPMLRDTVLRVAHEFVGNAVKHGMHVRLVGRIAVTVTGDGDGVRLEVADDGWGCGTSPRPGEGTSVAERLAAAVGGRVGLHRQDEKWTVATLRLPGLASLPIANPGPPAR